MIPHSLFPIPGPSPTTDRIATEVNNTAGDIGGWATAAIAGIVSILVTLLTQSITHWREEKTWLREKVFDIVQRMDDSYNVIVTENARIPSLIDHPDVSSPTDVRDFLKKRDWTAMDEAIRGYTVAARQLRLLIRSSSLHFLLTDAQVKAELTVEYTKGTLFMPDDALPGPKGYTLSRPQDYADLRDQHDDLMAAISEAYFEPKLWKRWQAVLDIPYRIWMRLTDPIRNYKAPGSR